MTRRWAHLCSQTSKEILLKVKIGTLSEKEKHNSLNEVRILASI